MNENKSTLKDIIEILPKIAWFILATIIVCINYQNISRLFDRIATAKSIKAGEFEANLGDYVSKKFTPYNENMKSKKQFYKIVSKIQEESILRRAEYLSDELKNTNILWIDDHPENNEITESFLEKLGVTIDNATSTQAAIKKLKDTSNHYNLIITDTYRTDSTDVSGIKFAQEANDSFPTPPIIICSEHFEKTYDTLKILPRGVFAETTRPDYLIHYVFDIIERGGAPYPGDLPKFQYSKDSIKAIFHKFGPEKTYKK